MKENFHGVQVFCEDLKPENVPTTSSTPKNITKVLTMQITMQKNLFDGIGC